MYEAIVPWWEVVAAGQMPDVPAVSPTFREFADILAGLRKWSSPVPGPHGREARDQRRSDRRTAGTEGSQQ